MRGFVAALSAETGDELWRTYFVPAKGEPGAETWGDLIEWGGGAAWLSGTFDPELNTLYWTTGNPWPDFTGDRSQRRQSLHLFAARAGSRTGKMKWHFQFTPHDTHDWDAQSWPVLIDTEIGGKMRKVVLHANRNGFFYVLDRTTGEFLRATKLIDKVTWASGIDAKGRPDSDSRQGSDARGQLGLPEREGRDQLDGPELSSRHGAALRDYARAVRHVQQLAAGAAADEELLRRRGDGRRRAGHPARHRSEDRQASVGISDDGRGPHVVRPVSTAGGVVFVGDDDGHSLRSTPRTASTCGISTWASC